MSRGLFFQKGVCGKGIQKEMRRKQHVPGPRGRRNTVHLEKQGSWAEKGRKDNVGEVGREQLDFLGLRDHV